MTPPDQTGDLAQRKVPARLSEQQLLASLHRLKFNISAGLERKGHALSGS